MNEFEKNNDMEGYLDDQSWKGLIPYPHHWICAICKEKQMVQPFNFGEQPKDYQCYDCNIKIKL